MPEQMEPLHLDDRTVALSGTASNVKTALAGNFTANKTHTGVVTLTDTSTVTATDITDISTAKDRKYKHH